jgi:hypothetical protein
MLCAVWYYASFFSLQKCFGNIKNKGGILGGKDIAAFCMSLRY